ncbi:MAG: DNA-formamidopyrimidine glycosylase [Minisyncoccia bacterium]
MPELPEVETIVRELNKAVKEQTIVDFWTDSPKNIKGHFNASQFHQLIIGRKILKTERKGKNILIFLDKDLVLWVHLKLTGHFLVGDFEYFHNQWQPKNETIFLEPQNRFLHWVFSLKNGRKLALSDMRKFAKLILLSQKDLKEEKDLNTLGLDPCSSDFTLTNFENTLLKRKGEIKVLLMDQKIISGLGNIYANEVLWEAKINPFKKVKDLKKNEIQRLFKAIKKILKLSIEHQGTSAKDDSYRQINGQKGSYTKFLKVYQREGEPCSRCGSLIKRAKQGSRSTFYCPHCQAL